MDYETLSILYQSRKTILKVLTDRGYNTAPYMKFGPVEIGAMLADASESQKDTVKYKPGAFRMDLELTPDAPKDHRLLPKCTVIYSMNKVKNRINSYVEELIDEKNEHAIDPKTTEVIVMLLEPVVEAFHLSSLYWYSQPDDRKMRLFFFQVHTLVNNPFDHVLVPKHELLPYSQHADFLKKNKIRSIKNLPVIKFHEDMIARLMGLQPGDIVKITRPSPSAGEYSIYRLCLP